MSWFRLDDHGAFHAKVVRAGNEAYGAWCRAGQWCSAHAQDGFIPLEVAHLIAPARVWATALKAGLLDPCPSDGYQIHDFNEYNPTAEEAQEKRERLHNVRSAAGRLGGIKSAAKRTGNIVKQPEAIASSKPKQVLGEQTEQIEAPSRPVPSPPHSTQKPGVGMWDLTETFFGAASGVIGTALQWTNSDRRQLGEVLLRRVEQAPDPVESTVATAIQWAQASQKHTLPSFLNWHNGGDKHPTVVAMTKPDPPPPAARSLFRGHE